MRGTAWKLAGVLTLVALAASGTGLSAAGKKAALPDSNWSHFGGDVNETHYSPLTQINDAVFRESPFGLGNGPWHAENAVTFDQALFAYTQAGANMTPWAKEIGSITVGKWADFVILDGTLPAPLDRSVRQRHVQSTYLAGKRVFEKH